MKISSRKRKVLFLISMMALPAFLVAASGTDGLSDAGTEAKTLVTKVIQAFQWAIAFLPLWSAWFFSSKMKEYLENKEEQGQYEPKAQKNFKIVAAIIVGVIAAYLVIGILSKVFTGTDFTTSWEKLVMDVWKNLLTI